MDIQVYQKLIHLTPLKDLECKHVLFGHPEEVFLDSARAGYENILFEAGQGGSVLDGVNRVIRMSNESDFQRPVCMVITSDGNVWCDSTHTALAYIVKYSYKSPSGCRLGDVPHYIVDYTEMKDGSPKVLAHTKVDVKEDTLIEQAVAHTLKLEERVREYGIRKGGLSYTIGDLKNALDFYTTPRMEQLHMMELSKRVKKLSEL